LLRFARVLLHSFDHEGLDMRTRFCACVALCLVLFGGWSQGVAKETAGSEIEELKKQMVLMEEQLRFLRQKVEQLEAKPVVQQEPIKPPAAPTFPSQFNPTLTLGIDTIGSYRSRNQGFNPGDGSGGRDGGRAFSNRPAGADFNLRSAELFIAADVDPFTKAYGVLNASADAAGNDEATLTVEEAAIVTTRLPYNLTVRGGRFFADFGTLAHRHDPELPFVDRPPSLDAFVGGESQTNGVEVSWLAPTPFYLKMTGAVGNKLGADTTDGVSAGQSRPIKGLTYLGRLLTYFDINDDHNVELGGSIAETPNAEDRTNVGRFERRLIGMDFKYRWYPLGRGLRQNLTLAGEWLYDVGEADSVNGGRRVNVLGAPVRQGAWGGYAYVEYRLSKEWRPGFRFDYFQLQSEPLMVTNPGTGLFGSTRNAAGHRTDNRTWSPYLAWYPSEFQRFRLQYNRADRGNANDVNEFFLQWTVFLGNHGHGFLERD
jgi:hypothetical protein